MNYLREIILSDDELRQITGYTQPAKVLTELHRQGFWRARRGPAGVILERAHYQAVCSGTFGKMPEAPRPKVKPAQPRWAKPA
ncbi:hypothetical protein [Piscinibacter koreensis]|uniref:DUF4224 domain-containing protein n=1 Tax=Piscinibacter koreensis TaxID=2742824 RepID=A0A7Y6NQU9_9BURK|nr:hypothetical protein [Schlegelella koreensis]NUZ07619.1 hypothetical protein [Schlegelella koreensis]